MDQPQHHGLPADDLTAPAFTFYHSDPEQSFNVPYNTMGSYHVVQHDGSQTRQLSVDEMQQQGLQYPNIMMPPHQYNQAPVYNTSPTPHVHIPLSSHSPPPPSPELYDPLSPPISGSDTSGEGLYNSSGTNSPSSSRGNSLVHRHIRGYNPTPSPTSSSGRRSRGRSQDSDDEDMGVAFHESLAHSRKEATRRQRIEAEQRRRDELRDGYARLKDVLPVSNQKSSKVSLLERATNHIVALESANRELQARLSQLEQEMTRLRALNEKISLPSNTPSPGLFDGRPLSPPPDVPLNTQALMPTRIQHATPEASSRSSPSVSDGGGY